VCLSESIASIRHGVQRALLQLGRVPEWHQTDKLHRAATHRIPDGKCVVVEGDGKRPFNADCLAIMRHFGIKARTTEVGAKARFLRGGHNSESSPWKPWSWRSRARRYARSARRRRAAGRRISRARWHSSPDRSSLTLWPVGFVAARRQLARRPVNATATPHLPHASLVGSGYGTVGAPDSGPLAGSPMKRWSRRSPANRAPSNY
jgi:hypothetical protein